MKSRSDSESHYNGPMNWDGKGCCQLFEWGGKCESKSIVSRNGSRLVERLSPAERNRRMRQARRAPYGISLNIALRILQLSVLPPNRGNE